MAFSFTRTCPRLRAPNLVSNISCSIVAAGPAEITYDHSIMTSPPSPPRFPRVCTTIVGREGKELSCGLGGFDPPRRPLCFPLLGSTTYYYYTSMYNSSRMHGARARRGCVKEKERGAKSFSPTNQGLWSLLLARHNEGEAWQSSLI